MAAAGTVRHLWSQLRPFPLYKRKAWAHAPPPRHLSRPHLAAPGRLGRHFAAASSLITGEFLQAALIMTSRRGKAARASDSESEGPWRMTHLSPSQLHRALIYWPFDEWRGRRAFFLGGRR